MRVITLPALCLALLIPPANAQISPETIGVETMAAPGDNWFISKSDGGGYIYDAETGDMHGLISLSNSTPAIEVSRSRGEIYAAEGYYDRGIRGNRAVVVTIYDFENLSPVAEIEIPQKIAMLELRTHVGLTRNGRFLLVFNMTPAQSVSVVDVENRNFVGEISTAGCAVIMPVNNDDFLMICGDGSLQLIQLNDGGSESNRVRSDSFFDVQVDPVFDVPVPSADGWWLVSHNGNAYDVSVDGDQIEISGPWDMLDEEDREGKWRPGGKLHLNSVHTASGFAYILMHEGEEYTHHEAGTEVWVYDINARRRIERIELEVPAENLFVTQSADPKLIVGDKEGGLHVYDAFKLTLDMTIEDAGPAPSVIQGF